MSLRKKCPYSELFWSALSAFSRIWIEYGEIRSISPYLVQMWENAGKMRTRITPNTDTFYAVCVSKYFAYHLTRTILSNQLKSAYQTSQFLSCNISLKRLILDDLIFCILINDIKDVKLENKSKIKCYAVLQFLEEVFHQTYIILLQ